jgi:hypothetical protein
VLSPAPSRLAVKEEEPMSLPLDLLIALAPFIVLSVLALLNR